MDPLNDVANLTQAENSAVAHRRKVFIDRYCEHLGHTRDEAELHLEHMKGPATDLLITSEHGHDLSEDYCSYVVEWLTWFLYLENEDHPMDYYVMGLRPEEKDEDSTLCDWWGDGLNYHQHVRATLQQWKCDETGAIAARDKVYKKLREEEHDIEETHGVKEDKHTLTKRSVEEQDDATAQHGNPETKSRKQLISANTAPTLKSEYIGKSFGPVPPALADAQWLTLDAAVEQNELGELEIRETDSLVSRSIWERSRQSPAAPTCRTKPSQSCLLLVYVSQSRWAHQRPKTCVARTADTRKKCTL
ncbi:hypothetical protein F5Y15DRAFT_379030 [Xylariaceae sp. FL0016]|nr:hypothetical protein F5Y15DRAFT_379030 [Xylariaceae sp. FL0016]